MDTRLAASGNSGCFPYQNIPGVDPPRKVGLLLGLGIFLFPYIFSWFTLRKGHTSKAKVISFVWLGLILFSVAARSPRNVSNTGSAFSSDSRQTQAKDTRSDKITLAKFERLSMGMSYVQAVSILGKGGIETGGNKFGDIETKVFHWDCGLMCGIDLYFQNGELAQKNQFGLNN